MRRVKIVIAILNVEVIPQQIVPRFWFFHEHLVDHNASVVSLFLIARGKKRLFTKRFVLILSLCRLSSYGELLDSLCFPVSIC